MLNDYECDDARDEKSNDHDDLDHIRSIQSTKCKSIHTNTARN